MANIVRGCGRWLLLADAAERYFGPDSGFDGKFLYRAIRAGKLAGSKFRNRWYTTLRYIDDAFEQIRQDVAPPPRLPSSSDITPSTLPLDDGQEAVKRCRTFIEEELGNAARKAALAANCFRTTPAPGKENPAPLATAPGNLDKSNE